MLSQNLKLRELFSGRLFILHVFLACVILFQITKPGIDLILKKIFVGILDHKNIFTWKTWKFYNTKFPDLWHIFGNTWRWLRFDTCVPQHMLASIPAGEQRLVHEYSKKLWMWTMNILTDPQVKHTASQYKSNRHMHTTLAVASSTRVRT